MKGLILFFLFLSCNVLAQDTFKAQYDLIMAKLPNDTRGSEELAAALLIRAQEEQNEEYIAKSNYLLGVIKYYDSRFYASTRFYTKALETDYARKTDKFREALYNNRGANLDFLNRVPEAMKDFNQSLKIAESRKDSTAIAQTLINIALLDVKAKRFEEAERTNKEVLQYFVSKKDTANISLCYQNLGLLYKDQGRLRLALENSKKALEYHRAVGYEYGIVQSLFIIGELYGMQDNISLSDSFFLESLTVLDQAQTDMQGMKAYIYINLAANNVEREEYGGVEDYLKKAYRLLIESGIVDNMDAYFFVSMDYYTRTGNFNAYKLKQQEYIEYTENKEEQKSLAKYNELKSFYGYEQKEQRIKEQKDQIAMMKMRVFYLCIIVAMALLFIFIRLYYYIKIKEYVRSLYVTNVNNLEKRFDSLAEEENDSHVELFNQIVDLMKVERPFLNPDYSISDLGDRLNTNKKYISQAINTHSSFNFNSFINSYRIDEAKRMIITNGSSVSLKVISFEAGFNNHTTFYRQFKEITGLTPTQFVELSTKDLESKAKAVA